MDREEVKRRVKRDFGSLADGVMGVLLYGSAVREDYHEGSDIDVCIVFPSVEKIGFSRKLLSEVRDERYDVRLFELMPLYLKMDVIENGEVVYARDIYELYEYFYPFRRLWDDQKHRQKLSKGEALAMFGVDARD